MGSKLINETKNSSPLLFIRMLLEKNISKNVELEFSKYTSGGQGITLNRFVFRLSLDQGILLKIDELIENLNEGEELAIHSNIYINKKRKCLPLIDFSFIEFDENTKKSVFKIHEYLNTSIYLFKTGRSYHGYSLKKLSPNAWKSYLGFLLLQNRPGNSFEIVDSRWIGHSLEQNFSALRLSNNSKFYLQYPSFSGTF